MKRVLWLGASWRIRVTTYLVLIIASIWVLLPFVWAFQNSVKNLTDTFNPAAIIPFINYQPTLTSWIKVLADPVAVRALLSSLIVSFGTTLLVLILGALDRPDPDLYHVQSDVRDRHHARCIS